jgi:hypothetical protein
MGPLAGHTSTVPGRVPQQKEKATPNNKNGPKAEEQEKDFKNAIPRDRIERITKVNFHHGLSIISPKRLHLGGRWLPLHFEH